MPGLLNDLNGESPYAIFGVPRDATRADIKRAFHRLMRDERLHPDVGEDSPEVAARLERVMAAHRVLDSAELRAQWDAANPLLDPTSFTRVQAEVERLSSQLERLHSELADAATELLSAQLADVRAQESLFLARAVAEESLSAVALGRNGSNLIKHEQALRQSTKYINTESANALGTSKDIKRRYDEFRKQEALAEKLLTERAKIVGDQLRDCPQSPELAKLRTSVERANLEWRNNHLSQMQDCHSSPELDLAKQDLSSAIEQSTKARARREETERMVARVGEVRLERKKRVELERRLLKREMVSSETGLTSKAMDDRARERLTRWIERGEWEQERLVARKATDSSAVQGEADEAGSKESQLQKLRPLLKQWSEAEAELPEALAKLLPLDVNDSGGLLAGGSAREKVESVLNAITSAADWWRVIEREQLGKAQDAARHEHASQVSVEQFSDGIAASVQEHRDELGVWDKAQGAQYVGLAKQEEHLRRAENEARERETHAGSLRERRRARTEQQRIREQQEKLLGDQQKILINRRKQWGAYGTNASHAWLGSHNAALVQEQTGYEPSTSYYVALERQRQRGLGEAARVEGECAQVYKQVDERVADLIGRISDVSLRQSEMDSRAKTDRSDTWAARRHSVQRICRISGGKPPKHARPQAPRHGGSRVVGALRRRPNRQDPDTRNQAPGSRAPSRR